MSLLVIGTLAYDSVETTQDRREGALGGSATYFAFAAAPLFAPRLVGVVGQDFAATDLALLERAGVDTSGVERAEGPTFRWGGRYEADWNTRHTLFTHLGVFERFDPKIPAAFRDSHYVFLANAHPSIQLAALLQIERPRFTVADTMNFWIDTAREELLDLLRRVDGVILNDEEARMLTGERNLIRAAQSVLGLGPRYVILKKGEHGAFLMGGDAHFALPAYPVTQVVDPTGAGDSFAGGFMGWIARERSYEPRTLRRAMLYGTVSASFCVQGFSVESLLDCDSSDYEERLDELLSIVTL
jgi:sugar/nucleoside kinase (ribokinase family)